MPRHDQRELTRREAEPLIAEKIHHGLFFNYINPVRREMVRIDRRLLDHPVLCREVPSDFERASQISGAVYEFLRGLGLGDFPRPGMDDPMVQVEWILPFGAVSIVRFDGQICLRLGAWFPYGGA